MKYLLTSNDLVGIMLTRGEEKNGILTVRSQSEASDKNYIMEGFLYEEVIKGLYTRRAYRS